MSVVGLKCRIITYLITCSQRPTDIIIPEALVFAAWLFVTTASALQLIRHVLHLHDRACISPDKAPAAVIDVQHAFAGISHHTKFLIRHPMTHAQGQKIKMEIELPSFH